MMTSALSMEIVSCPRCGFDDYRTRFTGRDHLHGTPGVFCACECLSCGLWFQNPRPDGATIDKAYPNVYAPHTLAGGFDPPLEPRLTALLRNEFAYPDVPMDPLRATHRWQRWKADVDLIPRFVPAGTLLEIGSASGGRLRALRALGWRELTGIELIESAAESARKSGLDVRSGAVESVIETLPTAHYDVVIASFVFEHLYRPFELIREIARVIKPRGEFLFSTITRDSLDKRVWGAYWSGFDFPRHMVYFNNSDLHRMVKPDFEWVSDARHAAPQDYARSAWWRLMAHRNLTDRVVGRLVKIPLVAAWGSHLLAWMNLACRISVRCRRT